MKEKINKLYIKRPIKAKRQTKLTNLKKKKNKKMKQRFPNLI